MEENKRESERRQIHLHKTFNCEFAFPEENVNHFIYIEDISLKGMQIHIDFPLPEDIDIPVIIHGHEELKLTIRKVWEKDLLGGLEIIGVEFINLTEENRNQISRFIETFSPEGKRKAYRLTRVLAVEMLLGDQPKKLYALTQDLSVKGVRILLEDPISAGTVFPLKIMLSFDKPPVDLMCKVIWEKPTSFGKHLIGLEFTQISDEDAKRVNEFIEACFEEDKEEQEKEGKKRIPLFEE